MNDTSKPLGFYFLVILLFFGVAFIGYNFGGIKGALIGLFFSAVVNAYAVTIKND